MSSRSVSVDLEIRITTESIEGRTFLNYVLHSPGNTVDLDPVAVRSDPIVGSPDLYHSKLINKIELLHAGLDVDRTPLLKKEIKERLEGIGRDLYHELFPLPLRTLYRKFRECVRTLLIISDEPWIPWEIIKPFDATDPMIDDDFLCAKYQLTRWLAGNMAAPSLIYAGNIACVVADDPPESKKTVRLGQSSRERTLIAKLSRKHPKVTDVSPLAATNQAILALLTRQRVGLLHFVGHGDTTLGHAEESSVLLAEDRPFRASDLHGPVTVKIKNSRPLVFFNACKVARQEWALTGLAGWVDRWVKRCGCGGFIGPQWVVGDKLAYEFASTFYHLIEEGKTLGEATCEARKRVRELDPGGTDWLAFSIFAHPCARVVWHQSESPLTTDDLSARGIPQDSSLAARETGSVYGDTPRPPNPYFAHRYILMQSRDLIGRRAELDQLTGWVNKPGNELRQARILNIVAIGGMGKSALIWKWFSDIAAQAMVPLSGRVWWSFYENDATFENFVTKTLAYTSSLSVREVLKIPMNDRQSKLFEILDREPFLIILDGLERSMIAYSGMDAARLMDDDLDRKTANEVVGAAGLPPSATDALIGQHRLRRAQDPRLGAFLRLLTGVRSSRILISTRLFPTELQDPFTRRAIPGSKALFLGGLRGADSLKLWRSLGLRGRGHEILPILDLVEHHPLVIRALAGEVACYRRAPGDFDRWQKDHPGFDPSRLPLVQVRSHVLAFAMRGLNEVSHHVARTIAAFRMPAAYDALRSILVDGEESRHNEPVVHAALSDLEDRGLVGWDRDANQYDMHPLVRGVIWSEMSRDERLSAYGDLRSHFESIPALYQYQVTQREMLTPAIELCHALAKLGRYDDAYKVYQLRINDTILDHLGSHHAIEILESFFTSGFDELPELSIKGYQSEAMADLAYAYERAGQQQRARSVFRNLIQISSRNGNVGTLRNTLGSFSLTCLNSGLFLEAETSARLLSRSGGSNFILAQILIARGEIEAAQSALKQQRERIVDRPEVVVGIDYALAACALRSGSPRTADALANRALEGARAIPSYERSERQLVQVMRLRGCAALDLGELSRSKEELQRALSKSRAINDIDGEIQTLVALAEVSRQQGDGEAARELLEDVWEPAERGPFVLVQADAFNVLARIEGEDDAATEAVIAAFRLAWCDGPPFSYHWALEKARAQLESLGVPAPDLPAFAEGRFLALEEVARLLNQT